MQRSISFEVSFQELFLENYFFNQCLDGENRVLFTRNVKHTFVFVIPKLKVDSAIGEIVLHHLMVVFRNCVMNWKIAIEVFGVQLRSDFVHYASLTCETNDMLNGLPLVVLLASSNVVLVGSGKPVKDFYFSFSSTNE